MRLISICVPCYNRPDTLRAALDSCFAQTYTNLEVLVGDDSSNDDCGRVVREYMDRFPGRLRYQWNRPALRQAENTNNLFDRAQGELLLLLHDDDLLMPTCVEQLAACWDRHPDLTVAFGKQYITDAAGTVLPRESEALNRTYHRIPAHAGLQAVPAVAGLLRMFPNDAFMIRTEVARAIRHRPPAVVGAACDTDFGLRASIAAVKVFFLDEYTSKYRVSEESETSRNQVQHFAYEVMRSAQVPPEAREAQRRAIQDLAPGATSCFARVGDPQQAWRVFCSADYRWTEKLRPRAVFHLLLIAAAYVRSARRSLPKAL